MKRFSQLTGVVALAAASAAALPEAHTAAFAAATPASATAAFDPYRVIIDRAIFGKPPARPAPAVPTAAAVEQQRAEALAKKITMCAVNRTPSGNTAVGFIDNEAKPPRNIYLNVGDTADGYTIRDADYDAETATIEKEGVVITLKLGKGLIGTGLPEQPAAVASAPPAEAAPAPPAPPGVVRRPGLIAPRHAVAPLTAPQRREMEHTLGEIRRIREAGGDVRSYMEKLRERREQEQSKRDAAEASARSELRELARQLTEEELAKRERQINISLIEQGAQPISEIELTPEEEADLVKKGVLDPQQP